MVLDGDSLSLGVASSELCGGSSWDCDDSLPVEVARVSFSCGPKIKDRAPITSTSTAVSTTQRNFPPADFDAADCAHPWAWCEPTRVLNSGTRSNSSRG